MNNTIPLFDETGLNLLDHNDTLGYKSKYITLLQEKAINSYISKGNGIALDVGCGYGRLSESLAKKGWETIGIDPDQSLVNFAKEHYSNISFIKGGLPNLPVQKNEANLIVIHNVLRMLVLMNQLKKFSGVTQYLKPNGKLVIVDNVWENHASTHLTHDKILKIAEKEGLILESVTPTHAGRWWLLYLIRYGLIPQKWFNKIAEYELNKRKSASLTPKITYLNVLYVFKKA